MFEKNENVETERGAILRDGYELTHGDRNVTYGDPGINLECQMRLYEIYAEYALPRNLHTAAHEAAIQHIFAKLARIACGVAHHRDNYIDLATYAAIAWECDNAFRPE